MKKIFLITLLIIMAVGGFVSAQQKIEQEIHRFDPARDPFADVKALLMKQQKIIKEYC